VNTRIKNFFSKPHNLLLFAAAWLFLQFAASVAYYYMQAILFYEFDYASDFAYLLYSLALFAVLAFFLAKKQNGAKSPILKIWFSVIMVYAFFEGAVFVKMFAMIYGDSIDAISNLWDNQHLYRFCFCVGAMVLVYLALYSSGKKTADLAFAGANLLAFFVFLMAVPDMGELLLAGEENILEVTGVVFVREIAVVALAANTFAFGLREMYANTKSEIKGD